MIKKKTQEANNRKRERERERERALQDGFSG
jgi:hypothetical protein